MTEEGFDPYAVNMTGTTIIAFNYQDGVMCVADTRTSSGTFIGNRASDKIDYISNYIVGMRTGVSSVTQNSIRQAAYQIQVHSTELGRLPHVKTAAKLLSDILYKDNLSGAFIVAGWDPYKGAQIYNVMLGGASVETNIAFSGSGSGYIMGYIDETYKEGMTFLQAKDFGVKAVKQAISRDASSGGSIRLVTIGQKGIYRQYLSNPQLNLK